MGYHIAFVIPAYNEESTVGKIVSTLLAKGTVVVVDDCSNDNTFKIAKTAGAHVVRHTNNKGYSESLNTGFSEAFNVIKADAVITVDADGEHSLDSIDNIIELLSNQNVPLVLGIRKKKNRLMEYFIGFFIKFLFGISDIFCGMKGYQKHIFFIKGTFDANNTVGTEFAISCIKGQVRYQEVMVMTNQRKDSSRFGIGIRGSLKLLSGILRAIRARPIKVTEE